MLLFLYLLPARAAPGDTHTIYQIQYTTSPGGNNTYPSPYVGQVVTTSGTVCAVYKRGYVVNENVGPWHGVYVYVGTSGTKPARGTLVQVTGAITEYRGMTEFSYPTRVRQMGEGPNVCTPTVVTAAAVPYNNPALAEPYEGTIVEYRNITITSVGTYSALFVDGSGGTGAISLGGNDVYVPSLSVGQRYEYVRGVLLPYWASEYRVWLASADDIRPWTSLRPPWPGPTRRRARRASTPTGPSARPSASPSAPPPSPPRPSGCRARPGPSPGTVSCDPATSQATFTPDGPLAPNALHTATLTADIRDRVGNPLVPYTWTFTTGPLDTVAPTVVGRFPAPEATDVPLSASVVITFSEELRPDTVVAANFTLTGPYGAVPWESLTYDPATYRVTLNRAACSSPLPATPSPSARA